MPQSSGKNLYGSKMTEAGIHLSKRATLNFQEFINNADLDWVKHFDKNKMIEF